MFLNAVNHQRHDGYVSCKSFMKSFEFKQAVVNTLRPYSWMFLSRLCYDFTQQQLPDPSFDIFIPRASIGSAANSGSSTPST